MSFLHLHSTPNHPSNLQSSWWEIFGRSTRWLSIKNGIYRMLSFVNYSETVNKKCKDRDCCTLQRIEGVGSFLLLIHAACLHRAPMTRWHDDWRQESFYIDIILLMTADDIGTYVSADIIGWYSHLRKKRHLANISLWKYNMHLKFKQNREHQDRSQS